MTVNTQALSSAVDGRLRSDARIAAGKASLWSMLGVATCILGVGGGVAAALYGYSFLNDSRPAATAIAAALGQALEKSTLKATATGKVTLAEGAEVDLARGAVVGIDRNTRLKLDPNAAIRADTVLNQPRLDERQLRTDAAPESGQAVVTNYTVFKSVKFGNDRVDTGWVYASSEASAPKSQHCYWGRAVKQGSEITVDLGVNRQLFGKPSSLVDVTKAGEYCQWYSD